ncbi:LuxR C-terminal-related transcriptional regulator [Actinoplanes sp. NPDC000266]
MSCVAVVVMNWPANGIPDLPPDSRAVLLCDPDDPPALEPAVRAGARGFLTLDAEPDDVVLAVEAVRHGGLYIAHELLGTLTSVSQRRRQELADREVEVLRWVSEGLTNEQIGLRMRLRTHTVASYLRQLRSKLNAATKAELTERGVELGYLASR